MKNFMRFLVFIFTIIATIYATRYYDGNYGDIK